MVSNSFSDLMTVDRSGDYFYVLESLKPCSDILVTAFLHLRCHKRMYALQLLER